MANRLAAATSPYLQQHKDNPVDWWEWSDGAFAEARRRGVPVLVSIGYAACHWCHVMAHESFDDAETAAYLNEHFVSIKVDREERPDVDAVYMDATQAMTGHGGWPMTVFTTATGQPFFAGTYYPPAPHPQMPSFRQVLESVAGAWAQDRGRVEAAGTEIATQLAARAAMPSGDRAPTEDQLSAAVRTLLREHDPANGGFGGAPKFPPSMVLEFLLRHSARTGQRLPLELVDRTCEAMARGGMYDQLAGGFSRYSVDATWTVPHFEKMLYDNALLLRVYLHWWRATGSSLARRVAEQTAAWMVRDLRTAQGGFASALDADSEGEEGRFYVWTPQQLTEVLGEEDGAWAAGLLQVTDEGTFEHGTSVLQLRREPDDADRWERVRARLLQARETRVAPGRDDKVVAAWNGLAIAALAEAGALLDRPEWVEAAESAGDLLVSVHLRDDRLLRTSRDGGAGPSAGVLEDYADVAEGFLALYAVTSDDAWLQLAGVLLEAVLSRFRDADGAFFDTAADQTDVRLASVRRPQDPTDGATPSGRAAAAGALLTYAAYTGSSRHREAAEQALTATSVLAGSHARFAGWGLAVAEAWVDGPREVAVVGPPGDEGTALLRRTALLGTAPGAAVAVGAPGGGDGQVALLQGRSLVGGRPAAYVCRHFTCDAPVTDAADLGRAVGALDALL
jgi:uncharacterized protein YyaL (SSP411 family)